MAEQEPTRDDGWEQEELPRRPRRRLLGAGANPLAVVLLAVLLIACGFIGGVLVEKGENEGGSGSGTASGLASRFAALRGGAAGSGARTGAGAAAFLGSGARPTAGQVAYLAGSTLYVTSAEGNTIKIDTSAATTVTKTVASAVKRIHPGEAVTVTGARGSGGAVTAETISVGSATGGIASLFGGAGRGSGTAGAGGGAPALFGG